MIKKLKMTECLICIDKITDEKDNQHCQHCHKPFHTDCINEWLQSKPTCPLCSRLFKITEISENDYKNKLHVHFNHTVCFDMVEINDWMQNNEIKHIEDIDYNELPLCGCLSYCYIYNNNITDIIHNYSPHHLDFIQVSVVNNQVYVMTLPYCKQFIKFINKHKHIFILPNLNHDNEHDEILYIDKYQPLNSYVLFHIYQSDITKYRPLTYYFMDEFSRCYVEFKN